LILERFINKGRLLSSEMVKYGSKKADVPELPAGKAMPKMSPEQMKKLEEAKKKQLELVKKVKEKLDALKKDLEPFVKDATAKYKKEVVGMVLVPPKKQGEPIDVLTLLELEGKDLREKFDKKLKIEKDLNEKVKKYAKVVARAVVLDELWDMCYRGKYDVLGLVAVGMPLYDNGWIGALRVTEMHKNMVLKKFEKYVVSYVLAGSMVRGEATKTSDIDTFVVVDDTDVTRMTSQELRKKLSGIILGMGAEAGMATGVRNKLNVQVYVLTDMWDSIRSANPIIFTFLRDGIPLYDRGMFMPWKLLLRKGKITPTPEAVDSYLKSGDQALKRIKFRLREIAVEDPFYSTLVPAQGLLMMIGVAPPTPSEAPALIRKHFVKPGLLEEEYAKILEANIKLRKGIEHGLIKDVSGKELDKHVKDSEKFVKRLKKLAVQVENIEVKKEIKDLYEKASEDVLAALKMVGAKAGKDLFKTFEKEVVEAKLAPRKYMEVLNKINDLNEKKEGSRLELNRLFFEQDRYARDVFDIIRAQKGHVVERYKLAAKYGKKRADIWLLGKEAYIVKDVTNPQTNIFKYSVGSKGELKDEKKVTLKDLNKDVQKYTGTVTEVTDDMIKSLKDILGKDLKLVVGA
jgi:uncharacterized protein (UPF0332 family)/predicted nucleotidyltransferase